MIQEVINDLLEVFRKHKSHLQGNSNTFTRGASENNPTITVNYTFGNSEDTDIQNNNPNCDY
ncbi:MAG: hypothetical protein EBU90_24315 [Proteobacteria bacterium]|nr:hypothetical protein [Pseudomonadota bacterium]